MLRGGLLFIASIEGVHMLLFPGWVMHTSIPGNFPRYFLYLAGSETVRRVVREGWEVAAGQVGGSLDFCGR